jgi:hypothetical protein
MSEVSGVKKPDARTVEQRCLERALITISYLNRKKENDEALSEAVQRGS